jgi:hypothetical protein
MGLLVKLYAATKMFRSAALMQDSTSSRIAPCGEKATVKDEPVGDGAVDGAQPGNSKQTVRARMQHTLRLNILMVLFRFGWFGQGRVVLFIDELCHAAKIVKLAIN